MGNDDNRGLDRSFRFLDQVDNRYPDDDPYIFGSYGDCEIRVASSIEDRRRAWELVYRVYAEKGYAEKDAQGLWYGIHDALPETTTFVVEREGDVVAALTVVFDSPLGLPADNLYGRELDTLRRQGRRLCEIVSLVSVERRMSLGANVLRHLFKLAYITARYLEKATDFVITVNPHHVQYYEKSLLFEELAGERTYEKVCGAPAVLLRLDLATAEEVYRAHFGHLSGERNLHRFFVNRIEDLKRWLQSRRRWLDEKSFEKYFIRSRPLLQEVEPRERDYITQQYLS
jgi:hypothetical protein